MAIYKGPVREQFTQIPNNTHQDTSISLQARGLLGYLVSLPDDWVVRPEQLAKANGIARNTAYKIIKELKDAGYIYQIQNRMESGKFSAGDYLVFRSLEDAEWYSESLGNKDSEPCTKKRDTVKRDTVKGQLSNKEEKKETSKSVNNACARENFSIGQILVELQTMNLPEKEIWYAQRKAQEFLDRFPESQSTADACRYVVNAIEHAWGLEGKNG